MSQASSLWILSQQKSRFFSLDLYREGGVAGFHACSPGLSERVALTNDSWNMANNEV